MVLTNLDIDMMKAQAAIFPLPYDVVPSGDNPLENVSDEALMSCPPHLICHIQRTAAQGGLQVISPRQTPFSSLMIRKAGEKRHLGDHDVGSIADPDLSWPELEDDDLGHLLPDEPLPKYTTSHTLRPKTKTHGLVKGDIELNDPVLGCLVKGRAVVDILRRDDVSGGDVEMSKLLAEAWGVSEDDINELGAYTLGVEGSLQRHAMKTDEVYPTLYAPVHVKSVISMGNTDLSKEVLPPDVAIDWRRCRVFCESVFYNACMLEGKPIKYMRGRVHPADPGSKANKPGTLSFYPSPGIAWTYAPSTFSLCPTNTKVPAPKFTIPLSVREALQRYVTRVRPVSALLDSGAHLTVWATATRELDRAVGETLSSNYSEVLRATTTGMSRGRTAAATVRNSIFNALEDASPQDQMRMSRMISITMEQWALVFGDENVSCDVVRQLALPLGSIGSLLRDKVAKEAVRRGMTLERWWTDILSQCPAELMQLKEGTHGWTAVALWHLFHEPTFKWSSLKKAVRYSALRNAERNSIGLMSLPPELGSAERLECASRMGVSRLATAFTGHYIGVADVGFALAREAERRGQSRTAVALREGAYLWRFRARALRGANVHLKPRGEEVDSPHHLVVRSDPVDLVIKPSPYRAYEAWKNHVQECPDFAPAIKRYVQDADCTQVYRVFERAPRSFMTCKETLITKYLLRPQELGKDLQKGWKFLREDLQAIADLVNGPPETVEADVDAPEGSEVTDVISALSEPAETPAGGGRSYWDLLAEMDPDEVDGIESCLAEMEEWRSEEIMYRTYTDLKQLMKLISVAEADKGAPRERASETVR